VSHAAGVYASNGIGMLNTLGEVSVKKKRNCDNEGGLDQIRLLIVETGKIPPHGDCRRSTKFLSDEMAGRSATKK
jgi:hypothetical protein